MRKCVVLFVLCLCLAFLSQTPCARELPLSRDVSRPLHQGRRPVQKHTPPSRSFSMQAAVEHAIRHNPGLGGTEAQQEASSHARRSARGAFGPKLGMVYSASKQERDTDPSSNVKPPEKGTYSWSVEISQPVFTGFRLLARYQQAALQEQSDRARLRQAELELTRDVQKEFLNYLRYDENARTRREAHRRLLDQLEITSAFHRVGLRPRLDVLQAEVDVRQAETVLIQMDNARETSLAHLNTMIGYPATFAIVYEGTLTYYPFRQTLEQCLETAYRSRPDLFIAALSVDISRKSQKEVQAGYYPQIEAYWNMTHSGNTPGLQRSGDYGSRSSTWEIGARATWDVFQWGTTYYADRQAGALVTRMRYAFEELKLTVGYEVKNRFLAVRESEKRIAVSRKAVEQAREAYEVALTRYQEQVGTNFDVLNASSNLSLAEAELTVAKADYFTALAELYVSMGIYHPDLLSAPDKGPGKGPARP